VALQPTAIGGFFYHPRLIAVVHLVSLGWITGSILGSLYIVGPLALRMPLPAGSGDQAAFASFAIGVLGMVSHFWIDRPAGMVWSGGMVTLAFAWVAARVLRGLPRAVVPREVKLHVGLALVNLLAVAALGLLLGINKLSPFLPFSQLSGVRAHAHLAVLGFALMMVMGAGYRLIPMVLPAAMPRGLWPWVTAVALQAGSLGLAVAMAVGQGLAAAAAITLAALVAFLLRVVWMLRHRRPAPAEMRRPDWCVVHVMQSLAYLVLAAALGAFLAVAPASEHALQATMAYGVFGLVGFLAQIVVGIEGRLLPLAAWLWGFSGGGFEASPPSLHRTPLRWLQALVLLLWTLGVPALAGGLYRGSDVVAASGAGLLCVATVANGANLAVVLRRSKAR